MKINPRYQKIIYTCPKCGYDLREKAFPNGDYLKICDNCGYKYTSRNDVIRIPFVEPSSIKHSPILIPLECANCYNHLANGGMCKGDRCNIDYERLCEVVNEA